MLEFIDIEAYSFDCKFCGSKDFVRERKLVEEELITLDEDCIITLAEDMHILTDWRYRCTGCDSSSETIEELLVNLPDPDDGICEGHPGLGFETEYCDGTCRV